MIIEKSKNQKIQSRRCIPAIAHNLSKYDLKLFLVQFRTVM